MIEVEIKARVEDHDSIKSNLSQLGAVLKEEKHQVDMIFGHPMFLDENRHIIEGGFSARIRKVNDRQRLDFKEIDRSGAGMEVSSDLSDMSIGIKFLEKMGWDEAFTIDKTRHQYCHKDFTICLDDVKRLGKFIEVEILLDSDAGKEEALERCRSFLEKIAPDAVITKKKYGDLMQELINGKEM